MVSFSQSPSRFEYFRAKAAAASAFADTGRLSELRALVNSLVEYRGLCVPPRLVISLKTKQGRDKRYCYFFQS